uniref:Innexin n=1 Tax=Strigamia maritima TaxID=126957 RepID=T1IHE1_STRMM
MSVLKPFSSAVLKPHTSARIDNFIFLLHYRFTALILTTAAILVTSTQHFGKPITCGPPPPALTIELLNNYCWTRSTFSLVEQRRDDPHPGVNTAKDSDPIFHHTYYQWVWLVLSLQAAMFYLPRYIWKTIDGGRMSHLVKGLTEPLCEKESMSVRISILGQYVLTNWNKMNNWAYAYFMCEILNFLNVIAQIYVIDAFLGGSFTTYGLRVVQYGLLEQENRNDSMMVVFPRVTKCGFKNFGPSGNVQVHDAICVLPLNIINEKIYVFLWFWLVLLFIPTGIVLLYRILLLVCPKLRVKVLRWQYQCFISDSGLRIGGWLFLNLLAKNVDSLALSMLLEELEVKKQESEWKWESQLKEVVINDGKSPSVSKRGDISDVVRDESLMELLKGEYKVGDKVVLLSSAGNKVLYSGPYVVTKRLGDCLYVFTNGERTVRAHISQTRPYFD